jgi:rod shape determining protein RodA
MTRTWRALLPPGLLLAVPAGLVILQPDLGTALAICFGAVVVIFMSGVPMWWFIAGGVGGAIAAPLAFFFALHDYQRKRVLVFMDPESDMLGSGYHITQSKIAIGSGASSARVSAMVRKAIWNICPRSTPTSSSPR